MNRKTILITGAAGAVGLEVLEELVKSAGHLDIRCFDLPVRKVHKSLKPYMKHIDFIGGSVEDRVALDKAVKGCDMVIHLAAIIPPLADKNIDLTSRVNIWGTHNLIESIRHMAPDAFLLFSSSISVYGDRITSPWISVGDSLNPSEGDIYGASKVTAEKLVQNSGLRYSIFRFSGILSPAPVTGRHMDHQMFNMPLNTSFEPATTRDCGFAMARSIYYMESLNGRIFNLGGGESFRIKYRELLRRTFGILGLDFEKVEKDAFATRNFHCGFYSDSEELENILHFQRDSVESYLEWISESIHPWRKFVLSLGRNRIIRYMLRHSDPLTARNAGNEVLINHFFGKPRGTTSKGIAPVL